MNDAEINQYFQDDNLRSLIAELKRQNKKLLESDRNQLRRQVLDLVLRSNKARQSTALSELLTFLSDGSEEVKEIIENFLKKVLIKERNFDPINFKLLKYFIEKHLKLNTLVAQLTRERDIEALEVLVKIYGEKPIAKAVKRLHSGGLASLRKTLAPQHTSRLARQFIGDLGQIDKSGVLLTCAEIQARKDYPFKPVVCGDTAELGDLCQFIKKNRAYLAGQETTFLVRMHGHWTSGLIQVDQKGAANILLIDSLGVRGTWGIYSTATLECLMNPFDSVNLFFSEDQRQHAEKGCSVFALDDARHLQTVHRYLPSKYDDTGVFGYLKRNSEEHALEIWLPSFEPKPEKHFFRSRLPLHLMRTMQSGKLLDEVVPTRDEGLPVNKKGELALASSQKFFRKTPGESRRNTRLKYKFHKMRDQNIAYLESHTDDVCKAAMESFTVQGFKDRVKLKTSKSAENLGKEPGSLLEPKLKP